jgi:hypothetical protein
MSVTIHTYYATRDRTLLGHIRAAHPDWRPGWVQAS